MKQRTLLMFQIALLGSFILPAAWGQEAEEPKPRPKLRARADQLDPDVVAIRSEAKAFREAFDRGDAAAIAAMWTKAGEYIDESGQRFRGRQAIERAYAAFFKDNPNAKIQIQVTSIRKVSDLVIIEEGRAIAEPAPAGAQGFTRYSVTHVKVDGDWQMASVRDKWVEAPAHAASGADLNWLVGTWVAEQRGTTLKYVCRWVANNSFIERRYTTTSVDGTKASGIQLIGWNPEVGHVQSWDFSPDGGHAIGTWYPQQEGWSADMNGTTGSGSRTSATNHLRKLDDNAYVWQSVQRTLDGQPLPDTDEVVLKRVAPNR